MSALATTTEFDSLDYSVNYMTLPPDIKEIADFIGKEFLATEKLIFLNCWRNKQPFCQTVFGARDAIIAFARTNEIELWAGF